MTPRYLVSSFTGRVVVPSFIIGFLFNVFPNTIAIVLVGDIVILYLWHQLWIVFAVFALISSSLRLFSLMRMHRSSAYAVKSVILSSLSRRLSSLSRYVFHNMGPRMEPCGHPRLIFFLAMHSGVLIWTSLRMSLRMSNSIIIEFALVCPFIFILSVFGFILFVSSSYLCCYSVQRERVSSVRYM